MLPFHPASSHVLPYGMFDFLGNSDLLHLSVVNQIVNQQATDWLHKRRQAFLQRLFGYFVFANLYEGKNITIRTRYDKHYHSNVQHLFRYLPELFQYIQDNNIKYLDLGCINSYGGHPESPYRMISPNHIELKEMGSQLLCLLSTNTTIHNCNLGLFESILSHAEVSDALEGNSTIEYISMRSNGSRTNFLEEPHTLWRSADGTCYWAHFRNT
jgi:hypothetical protein